MWRRTRRSFSIAMLKDTLNPTSQCLCTKMDGYRVCIVCSLVKLTGQFLLAALFIIIIIVIIIFLAYITHIDWKTNSRTNYNDKSHSKRNHFSYLWEFEIDAYKISQHNQHSIFVRLWTLSANPRCWKETMQ